MASDRSSPVEPPEPPERPTATFGQVLRAVLWSFFGVRKGDAMAHDTVTIRPWQVILVGIALAALLVVGLATLVRFIVANAT
jgi:hypothetical protein